MSDWDASEPTGGPDAPPAPRVEVGHVLSGRYRLDAPLAQRGGTVTWRAFDTKLSRAVLVHLLAAEDRRTDVSLDAARKAATVSDSRFLHVLDALSSEEAVDADGDVEAPAVIVCEFAPGRSLAQVLAEAPLSGLEAAWIVRELADALTTQHAAGLFHQRLNPETVILTSTGGVKIAGFLIEAALHPEPGRASTWSEREAGDVRALGKILYAGLVSEWPLETGEVGPDFGLAHAQPDPHGWITPRQVHAGVAPVLDAITDRVLSDVPRNNQQPIRTASQLMLALSTALGAADASADLERRLHHTRQTVRTDSRGALAAAHSAIARGSAPDNAAIARGSAPDSASTTDPAGRTDDTVATAAAAAMDATQAVPGRPQSGEATHTVWDQDATAPYTPVPAPVRPPTAVSPATGQTRVQTSVQPAVSPGSASPDGAHNAAPAPQRRTNRRWLTLVILAVALAIVAALIQAFSGDKDDTSGSPTSVARTVIPISGVDDFDPSGDGGNDQENPNQLALAYDKDPATAWHTLTYLNRAKLGGLKPGVGLVLDLGTPVEVGRVTLKMIGTPTSLELRVPASGASPVPMSGINKWTRVAVEPTGGTTVVLEPSAPVTTRYLLVYATSLPNVGGNKYQAAIAEIVVSA